MYRTTRAAGFRVVLGTALGLLGLPTGCMLREVPGTGAETPPGDYGRWTTSRSRHFVLHTDAGVGAIDAILTRFEDSYEALSATFFPRAIVSRVEVLVFADASEYRAVAGNSAGKFLPGVGETGSLLVVRNSEDERALDTVVAHELAHRFADAICPGLPNWLDEGIAMYLESLEVREDQVRFGAAPRDTGHGFAVAGGVSFSELIRVRPQQCLAG